MAPDLQLSVAPTPHTAAAVRLLRTARRQIPCVGSLCAALDVGARVFGYDAATEIGAHSGSAALVVDVAVYHLTGAMTDIPAALNGFRRAAGPLLEPTRR